MHRFFILFFILFFSSSGFSQTTEFKGTIIVEDSFGVAGGFVIFPLTGDTILIEEDGMAKINLTDPDRRVFYFFWSGWKSKLFRFKSSDCDSSVYKIKVPDSLFYRQFYQQKTCPLCMNSKNVISIKYGLPSERMFKDAQKGKIQLGGCVIYDYNPQFHCKKHDFDF